MLHLFKPIDLQWLLVEAYGPVDFAKSIHTYIYIYLMIFFLRAAACMFLLNRIAGPNFFLFRLRLKQWHTTPVLLCSVGLQSVPWLFLHIIKVSVWILRKGKLQISHRDPRFDETCVFVDWFFGQHQWPLLVIIYILVPRGPITWGW